MDVMYRMYTADFISTFMKRCLSQIFDDGEVDVHIFTDIKVLSYKGQVTVTHNAYTETFDVLFYNGCVEKQIVEYCSALTVIVRDNYRKYLLEKEN